MTAPSCTGSDDGLHRWRFGIGRMAGTPRYACDSCHVIALPTGDGLAEDYAYLGQSGVVVRDDGRRPYVVTLTLGAYVTVHVMAADDSEAAALAPAEADDVLGLAGDRVADYGVDLIGPAYVADVEEVAEGVPA